MTKKKKNFKTLNILQDLRIPGPSMNGEWTVILSMKIKTQIRLDHNVNHDFLHAKTSAQTFLA